MAQTKEIPTTVVKCTKMSEQCTDAAYKDGCCATFTWKTLGTSVAAGSAGATRAAALKTAGFQDTSVASAGSAASICLTKALMTDWGVTATASASVDANTAVMTYATAEAGKTGIYTVACLGASKIAVAVSAVAAVALTQF